MGEVSSYVCVGGLGSSSDLQTVLYGFTHGSLCQPILFIFHINDIMGILLMAGTTLLVLMTSFSGTSYVLLLTTMHYTSYQ